MSDCSSFVQWHQYMHDAVPVNMYSSNMHYLQYIPEIVKLLGPLRCISARSMERAIGKSTFCKILSVYIQMYNKILI